jgi:hypothetical protein
LWLRDGPRPSPLNAVCRNRRACSHNPANLQSIRRHGMYFLHTYKKMDIARSTFCSKVRSRLLGMRSFCSLGRPGQLSPRHKLTYMGRSFVARLQPIISALILRDIPPQCRGHHDIGCDRLAHVVLGGIQRSRPRLAPLTGKER